MRLSQGTRLGPYEILSLLGAGGMGEVYRAKDTRLGRDVAVKVLPAAYSNDPDRLQRFEQEARAVGMLNHPNILTIYDIGAHDGSPYVVSELLEGETLRDRLGIPGESGSPLPPRKAIEFAIQFAHGLAAAHQKGIVHRDLKPENLFITTEGRLKILDFGLAKLTQPEAAAGQTAGPTAGLTDPGVVMGTAGYMSPEQVRAQPADARSDIFSFGVILYEMLSGRRAFQGESGFETMNAILKEDPPELSASGRNIPPGLEGIVRHCLEKGPEERFQSARDLAFHLDALSSQSGVSAARPAPLPERSRHRFGTLLVVLAGVTLLALGFLAGKRIGSGAKASAPVFYRLTFHNGNILSARFTPDGQTVVYGAAWNGKPMEIFSTRRENPESRPLGFVNASLFSISSSGEIALKLDRSPKEGTLARVPLTGGAPREVSEEVRYADWAPNGASLAINRRAGLKNRLEFPIGKVIYETFDSICCPRVSPKGDLIALGEANGGRAGVAVIDLAGKKRTLSTGWKAVDYLAWSPTGDEVWFTATETGLGHAIHAVSVSRSPAVRLVLQMAGPIVLHDISRDGRALITRHTYRHGMMSLQPGETREHDLAWLDGDSPAALSDDGKMLVLNEFGEASGATYPVYLRKTDGSDAVRLGEGPAYSLSADGKWVITIPVPNVSALVLLPTGAGESRTLKNDTIKSYGGAAWFPDGKRIVAIGAEGENHNSRSWVLDATGAKPRAITPEGVTGLLISPDNKFLLAIDADHKRALYPVEGGEPHTVQGFEAADEAIRWSADGRSVFVRQQADLGAKIFLLEVATGGRRLGGRRLWKELAVAEPAGTTGISNILLTPDGKSYVYRYARNLTDLYLVEGLK